MATQAHCAFCFESLAASFERRQPLSLAQTEELWELWKAASGKTPLHGANHAATASAPEDDDSDMTDIDTDDAPPTRRPAAISRLLNRDSNSSSSSSLPSANSSTSSSKSASGTATPASSTSSQSSLSSPKRERHPLFITWNTVSKSGHKSLRGCIGTFEAQELEHGLRSYALTSAFEDVRFQPIPSSLMPSLACSVTLLTNFSTPSKEPLAWELGTHGIRISFTYHSRRCGATYLPDVAPEQGWTKEEAIVSLMRKAGWSGNSSSWQRVWRDGKGELVTYEGKKVELKHAEWKEWREWVEDQGIESSGKS